MCSYVNQSWISVYKSDQWLLWLVACLLIEFVISGLSSLGDQIESPDDHLVAVLSNIRVI